MQFAVALIEYLISGIVASAWLLFLIGNYVPISIEQLDKFKDFLIVIYFPIAYILGIYIDTISSFIIRRAKEIDKIANNRVGMYALARLYIGKAYIFIAGQPKSDSYERSAQILSYSIPDAVRTMEAYVSRDRIARGMAMNAFCGAVTVALYAPIEWKMQLVSICSVFFVISILAYKRLRRLSSRFKRVVIPHIIKATPSDSEKLVK